MIFFFTSTFLLGNSFLGHFSFLGPFFHLHLDNFLRVNKQALFEINRMPEHY